MSIRDSLPGGNLPADPVLCPVNPIGHEWDGLGCRWCPATRTPGEAIVSGLASRRGGDRDSARTLLDAHRADVLTEAIDDLTNCLRLGGQTQRGLILARKRLIARRDGDTPEPPRRNVRHPQIAERCREKPGEWLTVGSYSSTSSAATTARMIQGAIVSRSSSATPYAPAGTFEARTAPDGERTRVEARYVGTAAEAGGGRG